MDILGIDIGTVSVKYVRMRGKGGIISRGEYPHKGGWEDLNFILTDIKDKEGTDVEIAVAVSSQDILKRTFTIPIMPKEETKEAIEWSASKVVTTPLEDMIYKNVVLGEVTERGLKKEEVLFIGANKEYINILLSIFETVGFRRIVAITDAGILYLSITAENREGAIGVVDIGGRQTGIYLFDNKKLRFIREILTASESFIDALMSEFDLSYDDAEKYLIERGINEESRHILSFPLDRLTGEIQRTFNVYARKYPERPITKIFVTGRASRMPNLTTMMQEVFVEDVIQLVSPFEVEDHFLPAYTLCMDTEPLVNLLPEKLKARKREMTLRSWLRVATMCVVALLFIPSISMMTNARKLQILIKSEQADITSKKEQLKLLGSITPASQYGEVVALKKEIEKKDTTFVTLLKYLASRLPKDVYLKDIEFSDRNRRPVVALKDHAKEPLQKEEQKLPETVKVPASEGLDQKAPSVGAATQQSTQAPGGIASGEPDYVVTIKGYIFGDIDVIEPALLNLVINLERSTLVRGVVVSQKEVKEVYGKKALEFVVTGRCVSHEI